MLLNRIFKNAPEIEIEQLSTDSRLPMKNAIFFCIAGLKFDGHDYIDEAIKNGAKVIVYSKDIEKNEKAIYVKVKNVYSVLISVSKIFFNDPTNKIQSYVVSGCYGRSSVSTLIYKYLNSKFNAGYIGRFGIKYENNNLSTSTPTIDTIDYFRYLCKMEEYKVKAVTFEASSTSLAYHKLDFIKPSIFVYTNSYKESADYREAGKDYFKNMRSYLYSLEEKTKVILNKDDDAFDELKDTIDNYVTYGFDEESDYLIKGLTISKKGLVFTLVHEEKEYEVISKLLSKSNCYNLTSCIAALVESGYDIDDVIKFYRTCNYVDGVFEVIDDEYHIVVDSAYTLDALREVFNYSKYVKGKNRIISLISISSWLDDEAVSEICAEAEKVSDIIILTTDEVESGDPLQLLHKADNNIKDTKSIILEDREFAIEEGINLLNTGDILFITGKGSESYLVTPNGKIQYETDKVIAKKYIEKRRHEYEINEIY